MAILGKIRSRGVFLIIIIALALFAFIIGDLIRQGSFSGKDQNEIGSVNGRTIERETFNRMVEAQGRRGGTTVSSVNAVWEQQVNAMILKDQIEAAGITVSDEQIADYFREIYAQYPQFLDEEGNFSEAQYQAFMTQMESTEQGRQRLAIDIQNAENQIARQEFFALLKSGIIGTNLEGETQYRLEYDKRDLKYINLPYSSIPDSAAQVSKAEIKAYMEKYPERFKTEEQRNIRYVLFEEKASEEDKEEIRNNLIELAKEPKSGRESLLTTDDIATFVNVNSSTPYNDDYVTRKSLGDQAEGIFATPEGEIYGPYEQNEMMKVTLVQDKKTMMDSVENKHILFSYQGATRANPAITRTKEEAQQMADSIYNIIGRDSTTFNKQYDRLMEMDSIATPQDIGWVVKTGNASGFAKPYRDYLYSNEAGDIGLVESDFGYHIILIEDKKSEIETVKLATISEEIIPSKKTSSSLFTSAQKFQQKAMQEDFEAAAEELEQEVRPVQDLKPLDENLPGISKPEREIVQWAFDKETEKGEIERFETADGFAIVQLTKIVEEGPTTVENASTKVLTKLRNEKKAEMIKKRITGSTVEEIAANQNERLQTTNAVTQKTPKLKAGDEPLVVGTAFGLEEGETSEPIAGENGVYVVQVVKINNAPELPSYRTESEKTATATANQATNRLLQALRKSAEIEDRRAEFY